MDLTAPHKEQFEKTIEYLRTEISGLRTGRATPALVEDVIVEAYGVKQQLKAVASIAVADAKTLTVDPWDKGLIQAVESAINNSDLGINPVNDGKLIRLPLPDLTQDRRQELIKVLHKKLEEARVAIRKIREEARKEIDNKEKAKEIGEDEKYNLQDDLDKAVKGYNEKVKEVGEEKEKEITTV
ncbi:ribosome recycling factor [Candidatus Parcubacteria bacterium]|jgi:ribosome recycling factor|nr:ribosome recycling factor [Candidatus Parcubacteria bacterium]MBT3949170.1 ribosome recycling factor [Candidatus Parcubacteria bacterium]